MQSILRAGATKTAGLKSIMARHLAFASQALGAIISLIPYIREYARRHLGNTNPSIAEFDRTKRVCLRPILLILGTPSTSR
jgi:vacuolar protein sorting-associated protein 54